MVKYRGKNKKSANLAGVAAPVSRQILYAVFIISGILAAGEVILRLSGFTYSTTPRSMKYVDWINDLGDSSDVPGMGRVVTTFHKDPDVFWFPDAGGGLTNSHGFRSPEIKKTRNPGVIRIACLGDSVTQNGYPSFPERLPEILSRDCPGKKFEVINAGVGSYSSYQGLMLFKKKILDFKPDIITVFFGWNDHWLAWSHTDRELASYWKAAAARNILGKSRLYQLMSKAAVIIRSKKTDGIRFRVPIDEYGENIKEISRTASANEIKTIVITAPTSITPASPVIKHLVERAKLFPHPEMINIVHSAYNDKIRTTALKNNIPLVDLEKIVEKMDNRTELFSDDIHFTQDGVELAAGLIAKRIKSELK